MRVEDLRVVLDFGNAQDLAESLADASTREVSASEVADALRAEGYLVIPTPWPEWATERADIKTLERLWIAAALAESSKGVRS